MNSPTIQTVAIYARVSKDDQDALNQMAELRGYCEKQGWPIFAEYIDEQSGGTEKRSRFQQMFEDANKRKFDLVLFWALDRFRREGTLPTFRHLERLNNAGVKFKSYTEQYIDSAGVFGDVVIAILATSAKLERARISERTKAGLARARAQGKVIGRPALSTATKEKIRALRYQGLSIRQVATKAGVSIGAVNKVLSANSHEPKVNLK
ncbi:MAG: recombinase family protein [Candidatus Competibacteraceae bacterium]|jgi:DNA invertase Pin-like site-specific DNA recombinase|nr:recombinase family protein [Candidatus Competibacteraceae bacterium]